MARIGRKLNSILALGLGPKYEVTLKNSSIELKKNSEVTWIHSWHKILKLSIIRKTEEGMSIMRIPVKFPRERNP
jgi:hypothetical protein